jgi:NADH dehydrogenase
VTGIDPRRRVIALQPEAGAANEFSYDRFVLAAGSALIRPTIPGLAEHAFDVDTYGAPNDWRAIPPCLGAAPPGRAAGPRW